MFQQSCLTRPHPYNAVVNILPSPEGVIVDVNESPAAAQPPGILYHFSPDLSLRDVVFSDVFQSVHASAKHAVSAELEHLRQLTRTK